ncbi:MAG: DUF3800 domain-containing protein [Planctomycetales bacterium]
MTTSFTAYIDESGDEGFVFDRVGQGSSEWFVLTAVVTRTENDGALVELMKSVRSDLAKPKDYGVHFRKLSHEQRVPWVSRIAGEKVRLISILCHKPSLKETEYLREKHRLYFYSVRYLFERISWLCRDAPRTAGNGKVSLVFSNRSGMSYDEIRNYMASLRQKSATDDSVRIAWPVIDESLISAIPHHVRAGLQVADCAASSFSWAVEKKYGYTEDRYARTLSPVIYRRKGVMMGYGIKMWPRDDCAAQIEEGGHPWLAEIDRKQKKAGSGPEDPTR